MKLLIQKLHADAKLPERAHEDDAGMDLFSQEDVVLLPAERRLVKTGIAMAIPSGFVGLIWDKSGLAAKAGVTTLGGVVDAGYRGEVQVIMMNLSQESHHIAVGDKIAQMLIQAVALPSIEEATELPEALRGDNGFGSTGK